MTKLMLNGRRAPLTRTPADVGLEFEDVEFSSTDGVELKGWFIPGAPAPGPVVVFVHGWMWNRLGNVAGQTPVPDRDVDFLPAIAGAARRRLPRAAVRPAPPRRERDARQGR